MNKLLLLVFFCLCEYIANAQSISSKQDKYNIGDPMTFDYSGGTGASTDWIGIYHPGDTPDGSPPSVIWDYIATPAGEKILTNQNQSEQLEAQIYVVHLFCCNGYGILATDTFELVGQAPAKIELTSYPFANDSVRFKWSGGTGNPADWIGIYNVGDIPGMQTSLVFSYVPTAEGEITIPTQDLAAGTYEAHLFCCDLYDIITSTPITVFDDLDPKLEFIGAPQQNKPLSFHYEGGTGSFSDWVGIYNDGDVPGLVSSISYVYVTGPNGDMTFDVVPELVPGSLYDAHFFCCDGYDILKSIENFMVGTNAINDLNSKPVFYTSNPSPAGHNVELIFTEKIQGNISVYNAIGQNLHVGKVSGQSTYDIGCLSKGAYTVTLNSENRNQILRLIVQ
jgi:hypothetical protein